MVNRKQSKGRTEGQAGPLKAYLPEEHQQLGLSILHLTRAELPGDVYQTTEVTTGTAIEVRASPPSFTIL